MTSPKPAGRISRWFASRGVVQQGDDDVLLRFLRARPRLRTALLGLGAFGLVATVVLTPLVDPLGRARIGMGRKEAIDAARRAALGRGIDVTGWRVFATVGADAERLREKRSPARSTPALDAIAPPVSLRVCFWNPGIGQHVLLRIAPDGRDIGFRHALPRKTPAAEVDPSLEAPLAEAAFQRRFPAPPGNGLKPGRKAREGGVDPKEGMKEGNAAAAREKAEFLWSGPVEGRPVTFRVTVAGGRIVDESVRIEEPQEAGTGESPGEAMSLVVLVLVAALSIGTAAFGLSRLGFRLKEKEVAFRRAFLLFGVLLVSGLLSRWMTDSVFFVQLDRIGEPSDAGIAGTVGFVFLGLVGGFSWAAGEGDLREALPGSVTSFDALLGGRFWSRNTGRSLLVGFAVTGIFGLASVLLSGSGRILGLDPPLRLEHFVSLVSDRWRGATLLMNVPTVLTVVAPLFFLMLPLSIRVARGPRKGLALFTVGYGLFGLLGLVSGIDGAPGSPGLAVAFALAAALSSVLALLWGDLLAVLVFFVVGDAPRAIGLALAQDDVSLRGTGIVLSAGFLVVAAAGAAAARRGREWREEEVRPLHARNAEERKVLRTEFELARTTRSSLMPASLAAPGGLSVADRIVTGSEIGGDYRDAFALSDGRWGWVVADGGGRGAGAAIATALAKGLLLGCAKRSYSATLTVGKVARGLDSAFGEGSLSGLVYCVHDPARGEVAITRLGGPFPKLYGRIGGRGWRAIPEADVTLPFPEGSSLVCWTDGIEAALDPWSALPVGEKSLAAALPDGPTTPERVVASLVRAAERKAGRFREGDVGDEITVVSISAVPPRGVA